jgi:hypothetical protein
MGEWSKKIGEYGENVVEGFLSAVGWNDPAKGIAINCSKQEGEHKNNEGKTVHTHGIDFLYSYINPLVDGQLNNVIISSKYKTEKYPNSPTKLFKEFFEDLVNTIDCFDSSEQKSQVIECQNQFSSINDIGVLFWLNNQKDSNDDLISVISNATIDLEMDKTVYIMDNKHVAFILDLISYIKATDKYHYSFFYPSTGQNINPISRIDNGTILPVEFFNSSIIPIRLENKNNPKEVSFFLGSIDGFDQDSFMRLMGLAKDLSKHLAGKVIIGFPDYNNLSHKNIVSMSKQGFGDSDFAKTVSAVSYHNPLDIF